MVSDRPHQLLLRVTMGGSALFAVALFVIYARTDSQLAFSQGADSLFDVLTAIILSWAVAIASQPQDENHPFGHSRAEPIAALIAAVIAGVLAVEVAQQAIWSLLNGSRPQLTWVVAALFAGKAVFKSIVVAVAWRHHRTMQRPSLRALMVDSRNDVLLNVVAVAGFFAARYGWDALDAWLALPVAAWIGYAGIGLAVENFKFLMGEAPPKERQLELLALAQAVPGVLGVHDLRVHYIGTKLQVHLHVEVGDEITVGRAHDIGEQVRIAVEADSEVAFCAVHIDTERDGL